MENAAARARSASAAAVYCAVLLLAAVLRRLMPRRVGEGGESWTGKNGTYPIALSPWML